MNSKAKFPGRNTVMSLEGCPGRRKGTSVDRRKMLAKTIVETGPIPPKIAALLAPIRLIPIDIKNEGSTVEKIAIVNA